MDEGVLHDDYGDPIDLTDKENIVWHLKEARRHNHELREENSELHAKVLYLTKCVNKQGEVISNYINDGGLAPT